MRISPAKGELNMIGKTKAEIVNVNRNYKDTLFRMIFKEKEQLLSLYNAVNGTDHDNPKDLQINTLENAVYMNFKNDISFVFGFYMNLYEHQSTFNPNIPLRNLFYIARLLEREINKQTLYSTGVIKIPTPKFVVFYNGLDQQPERRELKLSDAFEKKLDDPWLELKVIMFNVNYGKNKEIMEHCQMLREYSLYVAKVRENSRYMEIGDAVERTVTECIQEGILAEFLARNRTEAIQVSIFEYDEEKELKLLRKAERESGIELGIKQGIKQGIGQGIEKGTVQTVVALIRKKHIKGKTAYEIAENLEMNVHMVNKVLAVLVTNPQMSDLEVAEKILEKSSEILNF